MIIKLILETIALDLSNYEFTFIEENNWLKDNTILKFTYPVDFELTIEQDEALGNITEQNLTEYNTLLEAKFYAFGLEHDAVLEIERIIGRKITGQIRYGLEEFPNFNKRLSELPLQNFNLTQSIYVHAKSIISQTWPAVNYNFPQVFTDKFNTSDEQWQFFEGIVNNYKDGDFVVNTFDDVDNLQINKNIIQPLPYLLHILTKGLEDAGFTLAGEILEDTYYKKATIYALNEFYTKFTTQSDVIQMRSDEFFDYEDNFNSHLFKKSIPFPEPGRYKIAGNVVIRAKSNGNNFDAYAYSLFQYQDTAVWSNNVFRFGGDYIETLYTLDFNLDYTGSEGDLEFFSAQLNYKLSNGEIINDALILDITLTQLAKYDNSGNLISTLVEPTAIDLRKSVPDMSFGEFFTAVLKKQNYGYDIDGSVITVNKKKVENVETGNALSLVDFEVKYPERNFNRGKTFILKTFDFQSEAYQAQQIFINNSGYIINNFEKNDDTEEIVINAIELPLKVSGVRTAHGFLDDNTKVQMVLYGGLANNLNLAEDATPISLLNNYLNDYQSWFQFLLTSQNINWFFETSYEKLADLKIRSIIYAYRQYHVIRKITRKTYITQKNGILLEVEIETETLN